MKKLISSIAMLFITACGGGGGGGSDVNVSYLGLYKGKLFLINNTCDSAPANDLETVFDINSDDTRSVLTETFPSDPLTSYTYLGSPIGFQSDEVVVTTSSVVPCGNFQATENRKITLTKVDNKNIQVIRSRDYAGSLCSNTPCSTTWEGRMAQE